MSLNILGISAYYHDSAAALIRDGEILSAAQEERFSRKKHDPRFPSHAVKYCLEHGNIDQKQLDFIVFYDKPLIKFERLLETYISFVPKGFQSFVMAMPVWLKDKLFLKNVLKRTLAELLEIKASELPPLLFSEHHRSHAASAFYPSPFNKAGILCLDGVGEWATSSVWLGEDNRLMPQWEIRFPHSLGLLYSAFTYYTGFKVNSGEYKLMGLAPYGSPKYAKLILDNLLDLKSDGTFKLDMSFFNYATGLSMTSDKLHDLLGGPPRKPESPITQKDMDIASSIQVVTEEIILRLCGSVHRELGVDNLCLAGGVALNCVANGRILREGSFDDVWVQPAAGDAGGALGAAMSVYHEYLRKPRGSRMEDTMQGAYLGPQYDDVHITHYLNTIKAPFIQYDDVDLLERVAQILKEGNIVGWFQGRMEFGPRALGGRSIIGDPRSSKMQTVMNLKIKYRESFRPFAPAVKWEKTSEWFELDRPSPYMLLVAHVKKEKCTPIPDNENELFGIDRLKTLRSLIPAVTHVDYSARVQTVHPETNPRFHQLLNVFERHTGCPLLVNTSFNVRGEPIVCTPEDAYRCFMRTEMDYLVLGNQILSKADQPEWKEKGDWRNEFELD